MSEIKKHREETYSEAKKSLLYRILQKITLNARNQFFNLFLVNNNYSENKSVIDIGSTPSLEKEQNTFLQKVKDNPNVTCLSNQDCKILQKKYKNIKKVIIGDAKNTMLENNSFDIVHSNATIEHIGSFEEQVLFVKEMFRISKESIFIQTPNRFYPIDFHTILPFVHWLPKKIHRKILKFLKLDFYAEEKNLNLLDIRELKKICEILKITKYKILKYKLFFLTSNLILVAYK
ncbi:MAG: methyltransferase domain-containing protein [Candidatus Pelagibacter sp.]